MSEIPTVNWPQKSGKYKVIQLYIDDEPYIRFPDPVYYNHGDMARQIFSIIYSVEEDSLPCNSSILNGPRHNIRGMGHSAVNVENKSAKFGGWSLGFPLEINEEHLNLMKERLPDWELLYLPPKL